MPGGAHLSDHTSREIARQPPCSARPWRCRFRRCSFRNGPNSNLRPRWLRGVLLPGAGWRGADARTRWHAVVRPACRRSVAPDRELAPWHNPVVVAISRSGTTTEIVRAAQKRDVPVVGHHDGPDAELSTTVDHSSPCLRRRTQRRHDRGIPCCSYSERLAAGRADHVLPSANLATFATPHMESCDARPARSWPQTRSLRMLGRRSRPFAGIEGCQDEGDDPNRFSGVRGS